MSGGAYKAKPERQVIPTFCAMCGPSAGCGIYAIVCDGRFVGVEGMQEAPTNQGRCCPKAYAAPQWVYSPQRLKHPLKRVGVRGEGKFQKIGWDEALDIIADQLTQQKARFGPESLGILSPARRTYSEFLFRFLIAHGSPNYGHSGICAQQKGFSFRYTLGSAPVPDLARSNLIVIWGKQPAFSGAPMGQWAGHYPDLIYRTISYSCMHCGKPSCLDACPTGAISKREEDGIVVVDRDKCDGCEACAEACPFGVSRFGQDGIMQKCDLCVDRLSQGQQPVCIGTCPSEALRFGTLEALSRLASAQQLTGSTQPSMLISSDKWSVLEPVLPWK